jgi:hypothetical protein
MLKKTELEVKETTNTASSASFLDIYLEFDDSGQISTKIYDKQRSRYWTRAIKRFALFDLLKSFLYIFTM